VSQLPARKSQQRQLLYALLNAISGNDYVYVKKLSDEKVAGWILKSQLTKMTENI
jgi:hypothetical protein